MRFTSYDTIFTSIYCFGYLLFIKLNASIALLSIKTILLMILITFDSKLNTSREFAVLMLPLETLSRSYALLLRTSIVN